MPARGIDRIVVGVEPDARQLAELSRPAVSDQLATRMAGHLLLAQATEVHDDSPWAASLT
jgi:hypothetical protein